MLSILVPVRNESNSLDDLYNYFDKNLVGINYEIIIINDFSDDDTFEKANLLPQKNSNFKVFNNKKKGLGGAINLGVEVAKGDFISIMMADQSDEINDLKKYYDIIKSENLDAVLGSRFMKDSKVIGYPFQKLILNRIFNLFVKIMFLNSYNDYTNAFKIYKRKVLIEIQPLISESFNIFLEMPLKIISRKYNYKVISINWVGRKKGYSYILFYRKNFIKFKEMKNLSLQKSVVVFFFIVIAILVLLTFIL